MPLEPGTVLTHFTVHEQIGAGGMGEVYRATDGKLGRGVAVKLLPAEVAADPDRLARFKREAQLLASLNHPNIAAIYGIEEAGDLHLLILELVEGEDLAARLRRGPVPVEEALGIALQIAEGLEEAHEHGIVHRDLKPANVKLTPAGKVKILDFGLAKAFEASPAGPDDPSLSPTLTAAATRAGVLMGTAAYMSPEQARGGSVDKRTDIWAFGCVLLEMLSGARSFAGDTISDTLASILKSDPDWEALPPGIQPALQRLLRRCLEKDRRKRLRDIGEARLAIEAMLSGAPQEEPERESPGRAPSRARALPLLAAVVLTAVATAAAVLYHRPAPARGDVEKYAFSFPGLILDETHKPVLSPDGRRILYAAADGLWIRDIGSLEARLLTGTAGASQPTWSPDGSMIAFNRQGGIWKVPQAGGQASSIVEGVGSLEASGGLSWNETDRIVFADGNSGIFEIATRGGEARSVAKPDLKAVQDLHQPWVLPGGRGVLYVAHRIASTYDSIRVFASSKRKTLLQIDDQGLRTPLYSPTGHLLYVRQSGNAGLWAAPFSLSDLKVTGDPFLVAREASFPSVASDGSLLYAWRAETPRRQLVWRDRQGKEVGTVGPELEGVQSPALSPDGRHVAAMIEENGTWDIWSLDVERGTRLRLSFTPAKDWDPEWSADGKQILFWDGKTHAISRKPSDGTGALERLVKEQFPDSGLPMVSPDGKVMIFWARNVETKGDIYVMPLEGERRPVPFLHSPFGEDEPRFSPDGKYVAYISNESGRREIYLTGFPGAEGKWQVSVNGGNDPKWDPLGGRLYYLQGADLMEVEIATRPSLSLGTPRKLFTVQGIEADAYWNDRFAVSADGQRFLFPKILQREGSKPTLVLVKNWLREFDRND